MRQVIALMGCLSAGFTTSPVAVGDTERFEVEQHDESGTQIVVWALGGTLLAAAVIEADDGGGSSY